MRKHRAGGRVEIDHPRGAQDDHANAMALSACAALDLATGGPVATQPTYDEMIDIIRAFPTFGIPNNIDRLDDEIHEGNLW
jgi:hypothetical protein